MNLNTVPKMGPPGGPILGPHAQLSKRTKEKHFHGPILGPSGGTKNETAKSQNPQQRPFFFPSGMADHALRLGPYMRRSCDQENFNMDTGGRMKHGKSKQTNHKPTEQKARRRSPSQICVSPSKDSKANSERGKSPTETTTKEICQGHSGKNPLCRNGFKNMQQTN